ncbi:MAG: phospholipase D-like domain-containing protein [Chlamydiales bacterium]
MKKLVYTLVSCFALFTAFAAEDDIIVCEHGVEMFNWDLEFVRHAEESIEGSLCFFGGFIAQDLLHALEQRMEERPALQVHILVTPILMEKEDSDLVAHMLSQFPNRFHIVYAYNQMTENPDIGSIDNHMKIFVVDEKYYAMGGSNYDDIAICVGTEPATKAPSGKPVPVNIPWASRDQDIVGRGAAAKILRHHFFNQYTLWEDFNEYGRIRELDPEKYSYRNHSFPVRGELVVDSFENCEKLIPLNKGQLKIVAGGPHQGMNHITQEYVRLMKLAQKEIIMANLYYNPPDPIYKLIKDANIPITIMTNGIRNTSPDCNELYCWANRVNYVPTFYGRTFHFWEKKKCADKSVKNTRIFEYNVWKTVLHKKAMTVDDRYAVIGSYNLGTKSDQCDYELIAVIDSPKAVEELKKVFATDKAHSQEVTPREARDWYFNPATFYLGELQKSFHSFV